MNHRRLLLAFALCLTAAAAGFGAYRWLHPPLAVAGAGELRPDLEFQGLDGKPHKLSEWNGKLLLLNFWGTWCAPCVEEIPLLVEAQHAHAAGGLQVVGVAIDEADAVRKFQQRFKMDYPLMIGQAEVFNAMDSLGDSLQALPFSVLISRDGRILERISGALTKDELQDLLSRYAVS